MNTSFIQWQLLELFDEEQITGKEKYRYSLFYADGLVLDFYVFPVKREVRLILYLEKNENTPIFDIHLEAISTITLHQATPNIQSIKIYRKENQETTPDQKAYESPVLEIIVKPTPYISFSL